MKKNLLSRFRDNVLRCSEAQLDALFGILKYREIGILRKVKAMASVLRLSDTDEADFIESLPKASDGRILDKPSRSIICDTLIERTKNSE